MKTILSYTLLALVLYTLLYYPFVLGSAGAFAFPIPLEPEFTFGVCVVDDFGVFVSGVTLLDGFGCCLFKSTLLEVLLLPLEPPV